MRIARDDFTGSGAWSSALWPFTDWQDTTGNFRPTLTQDSGLGVITNYSQDYGYVRRYFGDGNARADYGLLVRGRFTTAGTNANMRIMLRSNRAAPSNGDKTYPSSGYHVFFERGNTTVSLQKSVNDSVTQLQNFTIASAPGTNWWNLRLEAEGTTVRVKFWVGTEASEPASFNRTVTDSSLASGEPAISTGYHANQVTQLEYFETYDFFTILQLSGSITATGAHSKRALKRLGGSITGAATLTARRVVTRLFAGSLTPGPGVLRRAVVRTVGGSIAPAASYSVGLISKRLGGSLTPSGPSLRRTPRRLLGGAIEASGVVLTRSVGRIAGRPGIVAVTVRAAGQIRARVRRG